MSKLAPNFWEKSIITRLYFVVGIMALLILLELLTVRFTMNKLSAARAFVGGESLWSKSQKNAALSLQRYAVTRSESDFSEFLAYLQVPNGDHAARLELLKPHPDEGVMRRGFLQGKIHPDDIQPMVDLLRGFYWVKQIGRAIEVWREADMLLEQMVAEGKNLHTAFADHHPERAPFILNHLKLINEQMTVLQEDFSNALGNGSRFLEFVVLTVLTIAVLMVETVGISLALLMARSLSRNLNSLVRAADSIGHGDFDTEISVSSGDEIGNLAAAVNRMRLLLRDSYGQLEKRVRERTTELAAMVAENKKLYGEATIALLRRDEFLSLASHELKTPVTSMLLQAQLMARSAGERTQTAEEVVRFAKFVERQLLRIDSLVGEMLDTSRVDLRKLSLTAEAVDLSAMLGEVAERFRPQLALAGIDLEFSCEKNLIVDCDSYRIEQVVTNLLTNAMKYAPQKPVSMKLTRQGDWAHIEVADHGPGIKPEEQERIFGRFERGESSRQIGGLGIGLFIAKAVVEAHGGRIHVESNMGAGATFHVLLPLQGRGRA